MNRNLAIPLSLSLLAFGIAPVKAQQTNASNSNELIPVIPMTVRFRTVPIYLQEALSGDSRYSSIEALVDDQRSELWIEIVLTERASANRVHYCNVQRTVGSMMERGEEAYFAPIKFRSVQDAGQKRLLTFQFADKAGESVEWQVALGGAESRAGSKVGIIPQPDRFGFALISGMQGAAELSGSTLQIKSPSSVSVSGVEPDDILITGTLCVTHASIAEIHPGTEIWNVDSSPARLEDRERWVLRSSGGRKRLLTIERASKDGILIRQEDPEYPDSAMAQLDVQHADGKFALHSVTFANQVNSLRISFEPGLSFPAPLMTDASDAIFSIDENEHNNVATGRISIERAVEAEHVTWRMDSPDWARAQTFETGVNVLLFGAVQ